MKITSLIAAATALAFVTASPADALIYDVNFEISDFDGAGMFFTTARISGTIETDGTIGALNTSNITGFDLLNTLDGVGALNINSALGGTYFQRGNGLFATDAGLSFDFDAAGPNNSIFDVSSNERCFAFLQTLNSCFGGTSGIGALIDAFDSSQPRAFEAQSGVVQFASVNGPVSAVPLPASALLLLTALAGLGFHSRFRHKIA